MSFIKEKNLKEKKMQTKLGLPPEKRFFFLESWAGLRAFYVESSEESTTKIFCSLNRLL